MVFLINVLKNLKKNKLNMIDLLIIILIKVNKQNIIKWFMKNYYYINNISIINYKKINN